MSSSSRSTQISDASSPSRSSQNIAGTDASMSELASSDACFSQSTDGSNVDVLRGRRVAHGGSNFCTSVLVRAAVAPRLSR